MQAILALDKWARLGRIIRQNGGVIKTISKLWRMDTLKVSFLGQIYAKELIKPSLIQSIFSHRIH